MKYIISENSIIVYLNGKIFTCWKDDKIYPKVIKAIKNKDYDNISMIFHENYINDAKEKLLNTGGKYIDHDSIL